MKTVKQVLQEKGRLIWSISPEATVFSALEMMAEKNVGALLVMVGDELIGIVTERDYARKVILHGKFSKDVKVEEIMTSKVICASPDYTVEDCMALMTEKHFRHLPVLEDGKLVGIISIGDVVKSIIIEQGYLINHLVNYITGR